MTTNSETNPLLDRPNRSISWLALITDFKKRWYINLFKSRLRGRKIVNISKITLTILSHFWNFNFLFTIPCNHFIRFWRWCCYSCFSCKWKKSFCNFFDFYQMLFCLLVFGCFMRLRRWMFLNCSVTAFIVSISTKIKTNKCCGTQKRNWMIELGNQLQTEISLAIS